MRLKWLLILLVAFGAWQHWQTRPVPMVAGAGVAVDAEPIQEEIPARREFQQGNYHIEALAAFEISARVLGAEHYHFDRGAELAPVDLALGWGPMSDPDLLRQISISQGGRFYHWHVEAFPIPRQQIENHSANMHLIPADDRIAAKLQAIRAGELIHMQGFLVEASAADGWRWRSSLTREDTGAGACELVWVTSVDVL